MKAFDIGNRKYKAIYSQFSVFVFNKYRTYAVKDRYYTMCLNQQKIKALNISMRDFILEFWQTNYFENMCLKKQITITKTCLYNFDPFKPHFYIVKLGFTGVYIIFQSFDRKHKLRVLVRTASPRRFLRVPTIYVLSRNMKNMRFFLSKNFQFLEVKFSIYLNRRVFVMQKQRMTSNFISSTHMNSYSRQYCGWLR